MTETNDKPLIKKVDDSRALRSDLAKKHKALVPQANRKTPEIAADFETLQRDGYVIIEGLLDKNTIEKIKTEAAELLGKTGRNTFEGIQTQRVYDVLSKTNIIDRLADHPRVLGLMDRMFLPNFLLSQAQIINILSGENAQMLHPDDGFYQIPRPRKALGLATIWAIDNFTAKNGATVLVPGSHNWGDDKMPNRDQTIPAIMPAGSVLIFVGTLWHGGGANESTAARMAVTCQYCETYLRQQENFLLELSRDRVRGMSPELQSLVGYSVMPPFMGMVNGQHPLRLLDANEAG